MSRKVINKTAYVLYAYSGTAVFSATANTIKFIIQPGQTITWTDTSNNSFYIGAPYTFPDDGHLYSLVGTTKTVLNMGPEIRLQDEEADTYTIQTISNQAYSTSGTTDVVYYDNPDCKDTSGTGGGTTTKTKTIEYTLDSHTTATPASFTEGDSVTITLTAADGYCIKTAKGTRYNYDTDKDESISFTISADKKTATATVNDTSDYGVYEVTGDSEAAPTPIKTKTIEYTLDSHTTATPESFKEGDTVTITLTAANGYYISAATGTRFNGNTEKDETIDFTIATDKKTATATVTDTTDYYIYEVTGESDAATTPTTLDGIVSIYLPTNEEMGKIGQQRYYIDTSTSTRVVIDLGAYIVNYIKLFIDISATGKTNCIMGYFNTGIEVNYTTDNILIIDCGQITIEGINQNALDFSDVDCKIFLPFIGFTTIDIDNVMNKTVKLLYKVNILNGDTVALIYADSILIDDENGNMGYTVPYIMNDNILNSLDYSFSGQYMLDKTPYILLSYREKLEDTPLYNGHTWEKISDLTGLTKFNDVVITGIDCTIEELTEIENLLKTGVIL